MNLGFESFVNSEECKTYKHEGEPHHSLRALLIQKSVKPMAFPAKPDSV